MLLEKVKKTVQKYNLLKEGDKVLLACSGGLDSTALLFLLMELREKLSLELFMAHFNHKLRKSAHDDEQFVRSMASEYSIPVFVGSEDVRLYAESRAVNLEEAGRELRYSFFEKTAPRCGATKIATGHTNTDQAETFLMRLMRGSGTRGLGGIHPVVKRKIIRPLIQVKREEIEAYLKERSIPYREDESNLDRRFLRNKIRLELIPYLQEKFEPRIIEHISQIADIFREEDYLLDSIINEKGERAISKKGDQVCLDLKFLASLPLAFRRRVVRSFIQEVKGDLRSISFYDVEMLLELKKEKECHVGKDLIFKREGDFLFLKKKARSNLSYEYFWDGQTPFEIKELGLKFKGKKLGERTTIPLDFEDNSRAFLNLEKITFPLKVRERKEGDRYQPLGAPGQKKLKEIMRAKGVLPSERNRKPVFFSKDEIVWVLGLPVSERFKIDNNIQEIFKIQVYK